MSKDKLKKQVAEMEKNVEEMNTKLAEMKEELEKPEGLPKPSVDQQYWIHDSMGNLHEFIWGRYTSECAANLAIGNVYYSEKEANDDLDRAYAEGQLRYLARCLNKTFNPKTIIYYHTYSGGWNTCDRGAYTCLGEIMFDNEKTALKAIELLEPKAKAILEGKHG